MRSLLAIQMDWLGGAVLYEEGHDHDEQRKTDSQSIHLGPPVFGLSSDSLSGRTGIILEKWNLDQIFGQPVRPVLRPELIPKDQ